MDYTTHTPTPDFQEQYLAFSSLRPIYISEGQFLNEYLWKGFYDTKCIELNQGRCLFNQIKVQGEWAAMTPLCREEDICSSFFAMEEYFHQVLHEPLRMYLVDSGCINLLDECPDFHKHYSYEEHRDTFDYIYEAERLRTLAGKALHKKKNHLNSFLKTYDGRFEYRNVCCKSLDDIREFHQRWLDERKVEDRLNTIASEEDGVLRVLEHCQDITLRMGSVYIDDQLQAYTMGSYKPSLSTAFIHIEKANPEFDGLYAYINQQFLIHAFPEAVLVNREDDLGQEGLRRSKLSYKPLRLEEKYMIYQKDAAEKEEA